MGLFRRSEPTPEVRELLDRAAADYADNAPNRDYVNQQAAKEQARNGASDSANSKRRR